LTGNSHRQVSPASRTGKFVSNNSQPVLANRQKVGPLPAPPGSGEPGKRCEAGQSGARPARKGHVPPGPPSTGVAPPRCGVVSGVTRSNQLRRAVASGLERRAAAWPVATDAFVHILLDVVRAYETLPERIMTFSSSAARCAPPPLRVRERHLA